MAFVRRGIETFPFEDMSEVATACSAGNLCPGHERGPVLVTVDRTGNGIIECWPSTAGIELGCALVQRRSAPPAIVDTWLVKLVIFAGSRRLSAFLA